MHSTSVSVDSVAFEGKATDAFAVTDLQVYPSAFFYLLLAVGIYLVRYRRHRYHLPRPTFRAWDVVVIFNIIAQLYVLIMAWYPPSTGRYGGDVSFWYGTYIVTGIGIVVLCAAYYMVWIWLLPMLKGYRIRQELVNLGDGAQTHQLVKVPVAKLADWDATHDAVGRQITTHAVDDRSSGDQKVSIETTKA
jgi:hypothetical protein